MVSRYPRPPPPTLAVEARIHVNGVNVTLQRGFIENFSVFLFKMLLQIPKETFASPIIKENPEDAVIKTTQNDVIYLNDSFLLYFQVRNKISPGAFFVL